MFNIQCPHCGKTSPLDLDNTNITIWNLREDGSCDFELEMYCEECDNCSTIKQKGKITLDK